MDGDSDHDILIEIRSDLKHFSDWAAHRPCARHEKELLLLTTEKKIDKKWWASIIGMIIALATAIGAFFK